MMPLCDFTKVSFREIVKYDYSEGATNKRHFQEEKLDFSYNK